MRIDTDEPWQEVNLFEESDINDQLLQHTKELPLKNAIKGEIVNILSFHYI